jgi:non-specific serine/threonine protein kinase
MSPEQARGESLDARTDLFSFGVVLYEAAAGVLPFAGNTMAVVCDAILNRAPLPLRELRPELPKEFEGIVSSLLMKDRNARVQSAAAVKHALEDLRSLAAVGQQQPKSSDDVRATAARPASARKWVGVIATVLVVSVVALWNYRNSGNDTASQIRSLAVLPLANISGDASQDHFVEGLTDALTNDLERIGTLRVISRASTAAYPGSKEGIPAILRELNADAVMEGSISRRGDTVRISVDVVRANGRQVWAET